MMPDPTGYAHHIAGREWLMARRSLESLARMMSGIDALPERPKAEAVPGSAGDARKKPYAVADGTAVIYVMGIITPEPSFYELFGLTATSPFRVQAQVVEALEDADVSAILLAIDSPGGETAGVKDLADTIYAGRATKPIHAYAIDQADSAAYWIGSQAGEFSANAIARVGSIGVYTVLYDMSKAAEEAGIRVLVIRSGPHKGTGVQGAKISDAEIEPYQEAIDDMTTVFVADVARGRVANPSAVRALATGRDWLGPRAVSIGLIDRVLTFDGALERVASVSAQGV